MLLAVSVAVPVVVVFDASCVHVGWVIKSLTANPLDAKGIC
jgi:hypothetical protein